MNRVHPPEHRIDGEKFYRPLDGVVIDDAKVFNEGSDHHMTITLSGTGAEQPLVMATDLASQANPGSWRITEGRPVAWWGLG